MLHVGSGWRQSNRPDPRVSISSLWAVGLLAARMSGRLLQRLLIDLAVRELVEKLVGLLLLGQRLLEQFGDIVLAARHGPGDRGPVARHLVVLDRLRVGEQGGIEQRTLLEFLQDLLALFDDAVDRLAGLAAGAAAHRLERLLQALDLMLGLFAMLGEGVLQLRAFHRTLHLAQRAQDLPLRVVEVSQEMDGQVVQRLAACHVFLALLVACRLRRQPLRRGYTPMIPSTPGLRRAAEIAAHVAIGLTRTGAAPTQRPSKN